MYNIFDFDTFFGRLQQQRPQTTVFVLSDSELAEYKRRNTEREIAELDCLIDSYKASIERIEATKAELTKSLPEAKEEKAEAW